MMRDIKAELARRQHLLAAHAFFRWLEKTDDREQVARAFSQLAFWVASAQDVLAINETRIEEARLRDIAWHQRKDSLGHDKWFYEDLRRLGVAAPARELHAPIRVAIHAVMAEVFFASNDLARITLLLALQSMDHVFSEATADWAERTGLDRALKYFSRFHVEIARPLSDRSLLDAICLDATVHAECFAVVERTHVAWTQIFDTLVRHNCGEALALAS